MARRFDECRDNIAVRVLCGEVKALVLLLERIEEEQELDAAQATSILSTLNQLLQLHLDWSAGGLAMEDLCRKLAKQFKKD